MSTVNNKHGFKTYFREQATCSLPSFFCILFPFTESSGCNEKKKNSNSSLVINIELKKYSHLRAEIVSKRLLFWPPEQFWYQRYLPSVQKENIIAWFITVIWIKKYWKLLSEKIIIPLLRLTFLNYMNQTLMPLEFQSLTTFCEERADIILITSKMRLFKSSAMYFNLWVCMVWKIFV